jgi:AcrR family transcriptional regulator
MQDTPRKGSDTKERILDVAAKPFSSTAASATSIEELIAAVDITKSGFFYHFKDKNELAKALLVRYVEREDALFDDLFARADELNEDPLHGFLELPDNAAVGRAKDRHRRHVNLRPGVHKTLPVRREADRVVAVFRGEQL